MHTHTQHGGLIEIEHEIKISCQTTSIVHIARQQLKQIHISNQLSKQWQRNHKHAYSHSMTN
jgi:hypothetical protein